jgi:hypothetical protein
MPTKILITMDELEAAREDYLGYCVFCGEERGECEPDAREYECETCGQPGVYGAEELLIMGALTVVE